MKFKERLQARIATFASDSKSRVDVAALTASYEERILGLLDRLRLEEKKLRSAVLDRPALVDLWPLHLLDGKGENQGSEELHWARVAFDQSEQAATNRLPSWPSEISQADIADLLQDSREPAAMPLVKALRAGWFYPREGLIAVADAAYQSSPGGEALVHGRRKLQQPLEVALQLFPLNECILLLNLIREVHSNATRRFIPISSRKEGRAAFGVISQGSKGPWLTEQSEWTDTKVELVWGGKPQPMQFAFEFGQGFEPALVKGILDELQADGLRDYLCLHRMAAEQGRTGTITWTWKEHSERTRYTRRIEQDNLSDSEAKAAVTSRLRRLKQGEIRQWRLKPETGRLGWVRMGPFGFIDIPAGVDAPDRTLERARIEINPVIYHGAHRKNIGSHFALLHEEVLSLDGPSLRLAVMLAFDFRYARDEGGGVRRSTRVLWEHANTRGGLPEKRRWPAADESLQRALDRLQKLDVIGSWSRESGAASANLMYDINPTTAWRDQVIHAVPPVLPVSTVNLPRIGSEFRQWRVDRNLSQNALAKLLEVGLATIKRAEMAPKERLGRALYKALRVRSLDAGEAPPVIGDSELLYQSSEDAD
jgi:hypothetical protein